MTSETLPSISNIEYLNLLETLLLKKLLVLLPALNILQLLKIGRHRRLLLLLLLLLLLSLLWCRRQGGQRDRFVLNHQRRRWSRWWWRRRCRRRGWSRGRVRLMSKGSQLLLLKGDKKKKKGERIKGKIIHKEQHGELLTNLLRSYYCIRLRRLREEMLCFYYRSPLLCSRTARHKTE